MVNGNYMGNIKEEAITRQAEKYTRLEHHFDSVIGKLAEININFRLANAKCRAHEISRNKTLLGLVATESQLARRHMQTNQMFSATAKPRQR